MINFVMMERREIVIDGKSLNFNYITGFIEFQTDLNEGRNNVEIESQFSIHEDQIEKNTNHHLSALKLKNLSLKKENENLKLKSDNVEKVLERLINENINLKHENHNLKNKNQAFKDGVVKLTKKLRLQEKEYQKKIKKKLYEILKPVFTIGQINKLMSPHKRIKWSQEDIAFAIALRSVSPKGYRYLRKKNHPLSSLSTLRKRASTVDFEPGVLSSVLKIMQFKSKTEPLINRLCVLYFDEVYISQKVEIDRKEKNKIGPHKRVQVGMVRDLFSKWKQPIYYNYDTALTDSIVNDTIGQLYIAGYIVVAFTTDLGSTNTTVWNSLNVGINETENCFFPHLRDLELKVFVFADTPHSIKLIRNHFLDSRFHFNGINLEKSCIDLNETDIDGSVRDLKIPHKLTQKHLDCSDSERQKVSLATQLFSHTTAQAIKFVGLNNFLNSSNWDDCANFFEVTNDWYDIFNSKFKHGKTKTSSGYGINLDEQNEILTEMTYYMKNIRVGNHRTILPFQKGIILNNTSLPQLLAYLKQNYSTEY